MCRVASDFAGQDARDPEVEHLQHAALVDDQVVGLDVEMDDPELVRVREAGAGVLDQLEPPAQRQGEASLNDAAQRLARHVLHRDERPSLVFARVEDGDDVGMAQPSRGARLADEPPPRHLVVHALRQSA